jgi:hypothetical protein
MYIDSLLFMCITTSEVGVYKGDAGFGSEAIIKL